MALGRREFLRNTGACVAGASAVALGFVPPVKALAQETRQYKLLRAKETRNNCTYCSVGCGLLMYSLGDGAKNAKPSIFHIEGDPDHPVSRGSLCPKGAGLVDFIHSETRLQYPSYRAPGSRKWKRISWEEATDRIARLLKDDRDKNFIQRNEKGELVNRWLSTGMLASSAASNETGLLDFKFARALGILGLDCQARLCHAPTVSALGASFGRGAMTNNWVDIKNANVVLIMGGNPAEAHPVGFKWVMEAKTRNAAQVLVVDPRFNRSAAVADFYAPIRAGSDAAFMLGVINYLLTHDKIQHEYVKAYTNATLIVREDFDFHEGLFSGYDAATRSYATTSWDYERDEQGFAKQDPTFQHPRCVLNLLRNYTSRYTPELVSQITGTPEKDFLHVCETLASTSVPDRTSTFLFALGWTHHTNGSQIIRAASMVQMLLGNVGMPGGGLNALRGHSNIQGYTDLGLLSTRLPGYMNLPKDSQQTLDAYLQAVTPKADEPKEVNYWHNAPKFFVSLMKTLWGDHATVSNNWGYDWLPKWDRSYDMLAYFERMQQGKVNGYIAQGFNPLAAMPDKNRMRDGLAKLRFLVTIDPLDTETSNFWQNEGVYNDVRPEDIQTEVFRLPSSCFAEENGSVVNSARWLQWHYAGTQPPGEAWNDGRILGTIFTKLRALYAKEGGVCPEPVLNMQWNYRDPEDPMPEEVAKEANGYALADIQDATGKVVVKKGELLPDFSVLKDDGTTASYCWVFAGSWTESGNQMARRDNTDTGLGNTPGWAWAWPANRRLLYNRASLDPQGRPWDPRRKIIEWNGQRWGGADVPDYPLTSPPGSGVGPFIMQSEGVGRLFAGASLVDGPFPEHYEPTESPVLAPALGSKVRHNPVARQFADEIPRMGNPSEFPYVATTYSITELFRHWTKHSHLNAIMQPEQFVEIGERLAGKLGVSAGDTVRVSSRRGYIEAKAVVTKRLKRLNVMGQEVDQVGVPCHWGFKGATRKGFLANTLTPAMGDANSQTPEFKAFLVNVEKV
ncbi:formate dehydrogenase-O major subunit [Acetobacter pasteurianus]|uniref:Formate dehydrogenase alpha subunit n=2 Tax=Acetobacter pasteurianus TaxID=438 RepID=C7JI22_ACEP3|nr:formate dehydrogenase-N subunit alpha [Acetobacter pasteurianus]ASC06782.1 Formate dehydrogenase [Acetobacter pasteurianus subsp. pasteurianus]BAH99626.1 formate dehydrogenase alpha subunit [Acetobacter pasteurianus IFO 3283-01]BAI02679.1 formate dehydrogenase alpha subunit [Acetobacter pasteurianus IFO 3283-03]BAI05725.1 formate dehydrogenase alpha subunit [Acetobacter pasteurianus IFO 3283-07]BAI08774.1 formate dehydrogenase alpha subunit [Acetobacter pasteurianus IFO 3283-22]